MGLLSRRRSDEQAVDDDLLRELREDADLGADRLDYYATCRKLYDGLVAPELTDDQRRFLELAGFGVTENWIRPVVDKLAARVSPRALLCATSPAAERWLQDSWWPSSKGDRLAQIAVRETIKLGDGFLFHGFDETLGVATVTWNSPDQVKIVVDDDTGRWLRVIKVWPSRFQGEAITRMNRYYPDRIEKWWAASEARGADWQRWDDGAAWPAPWTMSGELPEEGDAEDPIGILVTHLVNRPDGVSIYGHSEIDAAVPFQKSIDKQLLDLFDVLDQLAHQVRWASGVDDEGKKLRVNFGSWITSRNDNAKFGALEGQDPSSVVEAIHATIRRESVATGTPLHGLDAGGTLPSGEALQTSNLDLTAKGRDCTIVLGDGLADAGTIGLRIQQAFGDAPAWNGDRITVEWEGVEVRNELQEAQIAVIDADLGASRATLLRRRGYDPDAEADQVAREAERAARRARAFAPPPPDGSDHDSEDRIADDAS